MIFLSSFESGAYQHFTVSVSEVTGFLVFFCFALKHQLRANVSYAALPSDLREMLQRRLGDLERQLLSKVAELEDEKSLLHNETSAHRQKTETALNALLERVSELEKGNSSGLKRFPMLINFVYSFLPVQETKCGP